MQILTIPAFLEYFDSTHARTRRAIEAVPPDRMDWTNAPGKFSFADQIRHLAAAERWMWAETVRGRPSRYPGHGRELADGHDAVVAYYDATTREARALFASLADHELHERCTTPGGALLPVWKWIRSMFEHEAHHRGQLHMMLGMIGVSAPPLFGLTSEEVHARSIPGV